MTLARPMPLGVNEPDAGARIQGADRIRATGIIASCLWGASAMRVLRPSPRMGPLSCGRSLTQDAR